jgi:hypothetical protein
MDHLDVDDIARGDLPLADPVAREHARRRLRARIDAEVVREERRRRIRRLSVPVAAAAIVALVLAIQVLLPPGGGGPALSAAAEIRHLGTLSTALPTLQLGSSSFLYHEIKIQGPESPTYIGTGTFTLNVTFTRQTWLAADGSGKTIKTYDAVSFASEDDRAMWQQLGKPQIPTVGESDPQTYGPHELTRYPVDQLPSDPEQLRRVLDAGTVIFEPPGNVNELSTIGELLAQGDVSPDVRAALFDLASQIPGVTVRQGALDPIGRPATAVSVVDAVRRTTLFFDAKEGTILGESETPNPGVAGDPTWMAYESAGVVDKAGVVPGA